MYGEKFKILSKRKNWIKIKTLFDNYKGFIKNSNYVDKFNPNYKVSAIKARIFKKPRIRTNNWLPFASKLSVLEKNKNYMKIEENKWIEKSAADGKLFYYNIQTKQSTWSKPDGQIQPRDEMADIPITEKQQLQILDI